MSDESTDDAGVAMLHEGERIVPRSELDPFDSADIDRYLSVETAAASPDITEIDDIAGDYEGLRVSVQQAESHDTTAWVVVTIGWDDIRQGAVVEVDGIGEIRTGTIQNVCGSCGLPWRTNDE